MRFKILILTFLIISCGSLGGARNNESNTGPSAEEKARQELFDPEVLPDPFIILPPSFEHRDEIKTFQVDRLMTVESTDTASVDSAKAEPGYRVQIFSTPNYVEANEALLNAMASIMEKMVYRSYDAPYYKIRVGDFLSRDEAEKFMIQSLKRSFPDSWIIRTMVFPYNSRIYEIGSDSLLFRDSVKTAIDTTFSPR